MQNFFLFLMLQLLLFIKLNAQQSAVSNNAFIKRFHSFNTIQLLNGSTTTSVSLSSVNGFQFSRLFAGIGVGYDYYYHRSIPLFTELRLNVAGKTRKLQLLANGGINIPIEQQNKNYENNRGPYKTGYYWAAGFDYHIPVRSDAITVGLAFSSKQIIQLVDNYIWNPVINNWENISIKEAFSLNRIAINLGWVI